MCHVELSLGTARFVFCIIIIERNSGLYLNCFTQLHYIFGALVMPNETLGYGCTVTRVRVSSFRTLLAQAKRVRVDVGHAGGTMSMHPASVLMPLSLRMTMIVPSLIILIITSTMIYYGRTDIVPKRLIVQPQSRRAARGTARSRGSREPRAAYQHRRGRPAPAPALVLEYPPEH